MVYHETDIYAFREHTDFAESTEEIAPLTEEEKKQKLEELKQKSAERKAKQAVIDAEERKKNEVLPLSIQTQNRLLTYFNIRKSG